MGYTVKWYGDKVLKEQEGNAWKRVYAAGLYLKARIQRNVSIPTAAAGPSAPGEYPHVVTGTLRKSIFLRPRRGELAVDVGTKLVYGIHWEVTNRPYIRRTFEEERANIQAILEGRMARTVEDVKGEAGEMKQRRLGWREQAKQRKQTAREAKQTKRSERAIKKEGIKWIKRQQEKERVKARLAKMPKIKRAAYMKAYRERMAERKARASGRKWIQKQQKKEREYPFKYYKKRYKGK